MCVYPNMLRRFIVNVYQVKLHDTVQKKKVVWLKSTVSVILYPMQLPWFKTKQGVQL